MPALRCSLLLASCWLLLSAVHAAEPVAGTATAGNLPDDAALEAAGARIGELVFSSYQIFDTSDPAENRALFRLANRLHVRTREPTLRAMLLFRSGDPYSRRLLEESERKLRELQFLREPRIRPLRYHDGLVDIEVESHDVWTLQIGPGFGRRGGTNHSSLSFEDSNLLGYGKTLILETRQDVDRDSNSFEWRDPGVFGSRWQDDFYYADTSDGHMRAAAIWRPFYALNAHRSYGLSWQDDALTDSRYRLGEPYDDYRRTHRGFDVYVGWSQGLRAGYTRRMTLGWRVLDDRFSVSATGSTIAPLPADRRLRFPYLQLQLISDRFSTARNLELIDRTEDLHFGLNAQALLGWASTNLGADRDAAIVRASASYGRALRAGQQLLVDAALDTRVEHGALRNLRTSLTAAWYLRTSPRTLLHVKLAAAAGSALDLDRYDELGGDNGLRGYPLRYQLGRSLQLFKVEERLYTGWTLWRLLDVGAAAFVDAGRVSGGNPLGAPRLGWLKDAGMGLRLGNRRSSLGNMFHIDLATPLDGAPGLDRVQLLVSTEASF